MRRLFLLGFLGFLWAGMGQAHAACHLPYVLNAGTVSDAAKVMADLNALAACHPSSLGVCSPTAEGSVPATGGGTANFLRADCIFAPATGAITLIDCQGDNHALQSNGTTNAFICVTDVAQFDKNQTWTRNQAMGPVILADGATILTDGLARNYFKVTLTGNSHVLAAPSNLQPGNYTWFINTGAGFTGFTTDASFRFFGGDPTAQWSTGAGKQDIINCLVDDALTLGCFAAFDSGGSGGGLALTNAHLLVGNASNIATDVTVSGDVTLANTGAFTIGAGKVSNSKLANAATTVNGVTCTLGSTCSITAAAAGVVVGTTTVGSGTSGRVLYDNAGVLGEMTTSGSGTVLALAASPSISALTVTGSFTATGLVTAADLFGTTGSGGNVVLATAPSISSLTVTTAFTATGLVTLADIATQAANTVLANVTAGSASPTAASLPSCSGNNKSLQYTSNTGFACVSDVANLDVADQTVSGGANVTALSLGTKSSGTTTIDCGSRPLQFLTNGGAFTLAAPANDGSCLVDSINNGSAGTITFSGFTVGASTGDALDTTNAHGFTISIWRINSVAGYRVAAHQ